MLALGARQVVGGLEVQPKSRVDVEKAPETNGGVGGHLAPLTDNVADPIGGHAKGLRERARRQPERLQIFLGENLPGMRAQPSHDALHSMVIDHLDAIGAAFRPHETHPPSIVDADAAAYA
jgi:hypothetical protein